MKINNRSDFELKIDVVDAVTKKAIELPKERFKIELYTKDGVSFAPRITMWSDDANIRRSDDNLYLIAAVHVGEGKYLPNGTLMCRLYIDEENKQYADGLRHIQRLINTGITIWDGDSEQSTMVNIELLTWYYKGSPGHTPVKGIDYFTTEEVAQMAAAAAAQVPTPDVSGQIMEHNAAEDAHGDLRELLRGAVGLPVYDPQTYALTFTTQSGATVVVDLPLEVMGLDYDPATKEMIYMSADGTKRRISLADFVDIYIGSVGPEIQITVDAGNVIRAKLLTGSVAMEHLNAALQAVIHSKVDTIPGKGLSANDYTDGDKALVATIADKAEAVKTYSTVVNTPIWTLQPTVEGALNAAFVAHPEDFYFVTLRAADGEALPAGQFRLTPSLDAQYKADHTKSIDQTFTLAGLNTGNSGVLKESDAVDFKAVGADWRMRSGGVRVLNIGIDELYTTGYDLNIYSSFKIYKAGYAYYLPFHVDSAIARSYYCFTGVGSGYTFANQFLFGPSSWANPRKHAYSNEVFRLKVLPSAVLVEYSRNIMGFDGTLSNRERISNNNNDGLRTNGIGFSLDKQNYPVSALKLRPLLDVHGVGVYLNGSSLNVELIKRT